MLFCTAFVGVGGGDRTLLNVFDRAISAWFRMFPPCETCWFGRHVHHCGLRQVQSLGSICAQSMRCPFVFSLGDGPRGRRGGPPDMG